jgi:N-acetylmuramoyl-L-alanine amidase
MFKAAKWLLMCAAVLLAGGCASTPPEAPEYETAWQTAGPRPAITLTNLPAQASQAATLAPSNPPPVRVEKPEPPAEGWVPLARWCKSNGLPPPIFRGLSSVPAWSAQSTNGTLTVRYASQIAWWNGVELRLGFAPQMIDKQFCLHALDVQKMLKPLLLGGGWPSLKQPPVLVLDPGHGGENPGTRSVANGRYEKDYTLDWAQRIQGLLATNGWRVLLTRNRDNDSALSNRVTFAEMQKADFFISLHFNSAGASSPEFGLETYCLTPAGEPSTLTRGFIDEIGTRFPNNAFDAQNLQLALRVHRELLGVNGHHDRGVRRARFTGVLRNQKCPAILVEGGYLSNPKEARQIADPSYRQKLAEAVCQALLRYTRSGS